MKSKLFFVFFLFPMMFFSQRQISDYFNNRIDFVLDTDYGRAFLGNIVTQYFKTDSINHFYNKTDILPFYRYTESKYFDKDFLKTEMPIMDNDKSSFDYTQDSGNYKNGTDYEFHLGVCRDADFEIFSNGHQVSSYLGGHFYRKSYYKFKNFELSSSSSNRKSRENIDKELYSNVNLSVLGVNIFEQKKFPEITFFNTLNIDYKNNNKNITFSVKIYETIGWHAGRLTENDVQYLDGYPDLLMRKVEITGNKEEAVKYLKKNKLDNEEAFPEKFKEEDFKKKDK